MESQNLAASQVWRQALPKIERQLSKPSFETFMKAMRPMALDQGIFVFSVPSLFAKEWVEGRYRRLILDTLEEVLTHGVDVQFVVADGEAPPAATFPAPAPRDPAVTRPLPSETLINGKYTFDTFVIGNGNRFAHAAALAVAEAPAKAYNPLFIYGGVGLGKTHLLQAIGYHVLTFKQMARVMYVSSEHFTNDLINSIRDDKTVQFRNKYRTADVLLIDDIQFLTGKERTQEEFFHTFNALHDTMKQIVIASDRSPKELAEIEDRLRSRFEWGLIADIQPPDLETKVAILQKKAEQEKVTLPTDVALYVAQNIRSNVRELEGALIRLVAHSSLIGAEITLPYAQQVLKNFIDSQARKVTIESIQKMVAEQFGLRLVEIKAKDNSRAIVYPRQIAMYLAKHMTEASLPEIGRQFGGKHHTTVLHSVEKIEEVRKNDKDLNRLLNKLTEQLGG